ncbi:MAG: amidohydrolase family protein [Planctomycetota bacterium]
MIPADGLRVSAAWVVVDADTILAHAAVVTRGDRIVWIGPADRAPDVDRAIDVEDGILLPGLVNAHAHLDLTALGGEVAGDGGLLAWLLRLIPQRARLTGAAIAAGVRDGARASLAGGATTVADIDSFRSCPRRAPLRGAASGGIARAARQ